MIIHNHLQSKFKNISETCCLALTYLSLVYWTVINLDNDELETKVVSTLMKALDDKSLLEDDASVVDADKFIKYCTGIDVKVIKRKISSLSEIKEDEVAAVNYVYNGNNHWVGCIGPKVVYNSLEKSKCLYLGNPVDARIIEVV